MGWSRRQVVAGGAIAAAGSLLLPRLGRAGTEEVDTIVVGAGLSGLYAAMVLGDGGASTLVLDGAPKAGGRCQTAYRWDPRIELGGVQIGQLYARVRYAAGRLGIPLGEGAHINAPYAFVLDGKLVAAGDWEKSPLNRTTGDERAVAPHALRYFYIEGRNPLRLLDEWRQPAAAQYDLSVAQWLDKQGASPEARRLISEAHGGDPLESMGLLRMFQEAAYGAMARSAAAMQQQGHQDIYERSATTSLHVEGGVTRLVNAMVAHLGDRVRLGHEVVSVEMDGNGCQVRCANGARLRSRTVVMAVPFSALRDVRIDPPLQGVQAEAVRQMPYGNQSQVWLRVKAPYWEADGIEASMFTDGPFSLIRQQIEYDGKRELISALSFGRKSVAVDALSPADRGRLAISTIEQVRPSTRGKLEFIGAQSWAQVPLIRGCSHSHVPGRGLAWAQEMASAHGRMHFAGEHLRRMEVGMEAAMESGEIAALAVMEQLA
jgi:monoamine oxidase